MRLLALVLVLLPIAARGQTVGSAEAYSAIAGAQNRAIESEMRWKAAKKLAVIRVPLDMKKPASYGMELDSMAEGQVGHLDYWAFKVLSVVDDRNVILSLGARAVWLEDYPTKDLIDDEEVRLVGPVKVGGVKSYQTTNGSERRIKSVKFVSAEEVAKEEAEGAKRKAAIEQAELDASFSTWTSAVGTKIEARFVDWKAGKIELQTKDGRTIQVTTSQLDEESAEKARKLLKELRAKK